MHNYHYTRAMLDNSTYMQPHRPTPYFPPFSSEHTRGILGPTTSTPQRFLLPTTSDQFVSPGMSLTPIPDNNHTVPQSDYTRRPSSETSDKTYLDESSRSYSPESSSEGELCIDESSILSSEDEHPTIRTSKRQREPYRRTLSISPASLQLSLLDRYKIPNQIPVVYHKNMARQFPESHGKTEQQKIQRKKNTEAARQSRAKAKLMETIVESECRQAATENVNAKRMIATQRAYANSLLRLIGNEEMDWSAKWREQETSRYNEV